MSKLLPCPFCMSVPNLPDGNGTQYEIECNDCGQAVVSVQICDLMTVDERASHTFHNYRYSEEFVERAKAVTSERWNTRATPARCDELVTVGWLWEYAQYRTDERGYYGYETVITENNPKDHVSPAEKLRNIRELVTRQNAEAVIAAERMKLEASARVGLRLSEQI